MIIIVSAHNISSKRFGACWPVSTGALVCMILRVLCTARSVQYSSAQDCYCCTVCALPDSTLKIPVGKCTRPLAVRRFKKLKSSVQ